MSTLRNRTVFTLLSTLAITVTSLVLAPAPSWAACDPQPPTGGGDCQPGPADGPIGIPPFQGLSPSDVKVNVTPGTVYPPSVNWSLPQLCLPAIQTPIPFVGFQPCI